MLMLGAPRFSGSTSSSESKLVLFGGRALNPRSFLFVMTPPDDNAEVRVQ